MPAKNLLLSLSCAMLLAGCASNPYRLTYSSILSDKVPKGEPTALQPSTGPAQLLNSNDMRADSIKLLEKGFYPIGRSKFRGQFVESRLALQQAQLVGADVVVVMQKHISTDTRSVAVTDWTPDKRIVTQERSTASATDAPAVQSVTRESVTTIEGEYQTHYVPQTVETYDQNASYWKKAQPPILGILGSDLEDADRKALQSNKGMMVKVVVRNSPAFIEDIFRGDIVRMLGEHEVLGTDDFFEQVMAQAGQTVELELWRNGRTVNKTVKLSQR
jgi:hypothetical protein